MRVDEAMRQLLLIFPGCEVASDNDGQLIVYTGLRVDGWDLVPFEPEEV